MIKLIALGALLLALSGCGGLTYTTGYGYDDGWHHRYWHEHDWRR